MTTTHSLPKMPVHNLRGPTPSFKSIAFISLKSVAEKKLTTKPLMQMTAHGFARTRTAMSGSLRDRQVNKMGAVKWVLWSQGDCLLCNCTVNVAVTTQSFSALQTTQPSCCRHFDLKLSSVKHLPMNGNSVTSRTALQDTGLNHTAFCCAAFIISCCS